MKLSVIIPCKNEEYNIGETILSLISVLDAAGITYEIIVVDDYSSDNSEKVVSSIKNDNVCCVANCYSPGFGNAVRAGIKFASGDIVAIVMGDASDEPYDLVRGYREILQGNDMVVFSRFEMGGSVCDYPISRLILNRCGNYLIKILFAVETSDITNAFKMYRRNILHAGELISESFEITVELPLKVILNGAKYIVLPVKWSNRKYGESKFKLYRTILKYFKIIFYLLKRKYTKNYGKSLRKR